MASAPRPGDRIREALLFLSAAVGVLALGILLGLILLPPLGAFLLGVAVYGAAQVISRWRWQLGLTAVALLVWYAYRNGDPR